MTFSTKQNGTALEVAVEGRLDTVTAPELEEKLMPVVGSFNELVFDFSKLEYISSAGLRVLLRAHRGLQFGGKTKLTGCNTIVREVLSVTGFDEILDIE